MCREHSGDLVWGQNAKEEIWREQVVRPGQVSLGTMTYTPGTDTFLNMPGFLIFGIRRKAANLAILVTSK